MKKKIGYIFLALIFLPFLFLLSACKTGESNEIKVGFAELKSIVSTDIDDWQGLNVSTTKDGKEVVSFKSIKNENQGTHDFVYENSDKKVFCEDGTSYYEENSRNYIVEDGNQYELCFNEVIKDNIQVINNFFDNISNQDNLKSSSMQEIEEGTKYEFEILLDSTSELKILGIYCIDLNGNIAKIIINLISNEEKISSEITENKNHITTPEWFDNNDYKVDMTASEIKEMVTDKALFKNWETIEIFYPKELKNTDNADNTIVFVDNNNHHYYEICGNKKLYADGAFVYKYIDNLPYSKNDISTSGNDCLNSFNFDDNITFIQEMISYLFDEIAEDFVVATKQYYKDKTIVSYKFVVDQGNWYNDAIISLYFDLNNEVYEGDMYTSFKSIDKDGNEDSFETNVYFKEIVWEEPSWFVKSDFDIYYDYGEIEDNETAIHTHIFSNWTIVDGVKQKYCEECGDILCELHYDYDNNIITLDKNGDKKTYVFGKSSGITTDPTIEVFPSCVEWNPADGQDFVEVYFPTVKLMGDYTEIEYMVKGPNGQNPIVEDVSTNDSVKMFKATAEGIYTLRVSYIKENGTSSIERNIRIGDCESPIIEWVNKDRDLISEARVNDVYRLDLCESLIFIDNQTKEDELLNNVIVRLIAPDGETVTNIGNDSCLEWRFSKVGNYTLKIKVKDNVGNVEALAYIISVKS